MHETEKVATVNAQRSNRQICCSRHHPLKREERKRKLVRKTKFHSFLIRQNKGENLNINKRN